MLLAWRGRRSGAGAGGAARAGHPVQGERPHVGGEPEGVVPAVAKSLHSVAAGPQRRGRHGAPVQRVQGEPAVHLRGQQEGQAVQAGAQQVRGHDEGRVPSDVLRVQGAAPP